MESPANPGRFTLGFPGRFNVQYLADVTRFDAALGKLLSYLNESGLREKTLLIYLSDNGWEQNYFRKTAKLGGSRGKATASEPGFRTPIIFSWPGHVRAGEIRSELVSSVDLVPTILDFVGVRRGPNLPGKSLYPLLSGTGGFDRKAVVGSLDLIKKKPLLDDLPESDIPTYVETMKRLCELPVDVVHGGHDDGFGRERLVEIANGYIATRC